MLAFLSILWGTSFVFIKIAAGGFDPFGFALGRVAVASVTLLIAASLMGLRWPRGRGLWLRLLAMAVFGQAVPFLLLGQAARMTTSADLALMMGAQPLFTFALGRLLGEGERATVRGAIGLALGFCGVAICLGVPFGAAAAQDASGWGRAMGLLAALGYATGALLSRQASLAVGPTMSATASMCLSSALMLVIWLAVDGAPGLWAPGEAPWRAIVALGVLGIVNTALAYFVYFRLVAVAGATFAALNNYIVPFLGVVIGAVTLSEPVKLTAWIGFALIVASVVTTGAGERGPPRAALRSST